jgi:hypothetical protein
VVEENADLFTCWEISFRQEDLHALDTHRIQGCRNKGVKIVGSPLRSKAEILSSGKKYFHVINHGFTVSDTDLGKTIVNEQPFQDFFDGIVVRCGLDDSLPDIFQMVNAANEDFGCDVNIHLRMTADHPGDYQNSDRIVCNRLAEAMAYGWTSSSVQIYCDTFTDNDRGYFPRAGVLDRRFNPRKGFHVVKALHSLFSQMGQAKRLASRSNDDGSQTLAVSSAGGTCEITLNPDAATTTTDGQWLDWQQGALLESVPGHEDGLPLVNVVSD